MQRTFIAIKVKAQKEMSDCIAHLQDSLRLEKLNWVSPINLHITLRFLGNTSPMQLKKVKKILMETVPGFNSPEVSFMGLALFRSVRDPKVLWIGMDPGPTLTELKGRLDELLPEAGYLAEKRKFLPHLTLARIKYIKDTELLEKLMREYQESFFQKDRVDELVFYESILRPSGPEYLELKKVPFKF